MVLSTAEMPFDALFAKIYRPALAHAFARTIRRDDRWSALCVGGGFSAAKMCRKTGEARLGCERASSNQKRAFARQVESPLSRTAQGGLNKGCLTGTGLWLCCDRNAERADVV